MNASDAPHRRLRVFVPGGDNPRTKLQNSLANNTEQRLEVRVSDLSWLGRRRGQFGPIWPAFQHFDVSAVARAKCVAQLFQVELRFVVDTECDRPGGPIRFDGPLLYPR